MQGGVCPWGSPTCILLKWNTWILIKFHWALCLLLPWLGDACVSQKTENQNETILSKKKMLQKWSSRNYIQICTSIFATYGTYIHYSDAVVSAMASQITSASIVCSDICSGADQRKHQSSTSSAFVKRGNPPVTGGFPSQRASNAENVSIWWRHHDMYTPSGNPLSSSNRTNMGKHDLWERMPLNCKDVYSQILFSTVSTIHIFVINRAVFKIGNICTSISHTGIM